MRFGRLLRHVAAPHWRTRMLFPKSTLDAIEQAVTRAERTHAGEIRFAIETSLAPLHVINDVSARARALEVFAHLKVWDTEHNNGVLIYVQLADHAVEIVADRGLQKRIAQSDWEAVCRLMEEHFRQGRYRAGAIAGVDAVGTLLARHYPAVAAPAAADAAAADAAAGDAAAGDPAAADAASANPAVSKRNQLPDRPTLL